MLQPLRSSGETVSNTTNHQHHDNRLEVKDERHATTPRETVPPSPPRYPPPGTSTRMRDDRHAPTHLLPLFQMRKREEKAERLCLPPSHGYRHQNQPSNHLMRVRSSTTNSVMRWQTCYNPPSSLFIFGMRKEERAERLCLPPSHQAPSITNHLHAVPSSNELQASVINAAKCNLSTQQNAFQCRSFNAMS